MTQTGCKRGAGVLTFVAMLIDDLRPLVESQPPLEWGRLGRHLPYGWIEYAIQASGSASVRRRRLPAQQISWSSTCFISTSCVADRAESVANEIDHVGDRNFRIIQLFGDRAMACILQRDRIKEHPFFRAIRRYEPPWPTAGAREQDDLSQPRQRRNYRTRLHRRPARQAHQAGTLE